jgi:hypothetical protein
MIFDLLFDLHPSLDVSPVTYFSDCWAGNDIYAFPYSQTHFHLRSRRSTVRCLVLVCKEWREMARRVFFRHVEVFTFQKLIALEGILDKIPVSIRPLPERIDFEVPLPGIDHWPISNDNNSLRMKNAFGATCANLRCLSVCSYGEFHLISVILREVLARLPKSLSFFEWLGASVRNKDFGPSIFSDELFPVLRQLPRFDGLQILSLSLPSISNSVEPIYYDPAPFCLPHAPTSLVVWVSEWDLPFLVCVGLTEFTSHVVEWDDFFSNHPHIKLLTIRGFGNVSLPLATSLQYLNELEHIVTDLHFIDNIALKLPKLRHISIYPEENSVQDANILTNILKCYPALERVRLLEFASTRSRFAEEVVPVWQDGVEEYRKGWKTVQLVDFSVFPENGESSEQS